MEEITAYPKQYIKQVRLKNKTIVRLRPICASDSLQAHTIEKKASQDSLYKRFMGHVNFTEKLVSQLTNIDYSKDMAIVAETSDDGIIAIARIAQEESKTVEFALIVGDLWQNKGLGRILTNYMIKIAREMNYEKIYGMVFSNNKSMIRILKKKGFVLKNDFSKVIRAEMTLV